MPGAIPPPPKAPQVEPKDPFVAEDQEAVFVPPIPSSVRPFDETSLTDSTIAEREAGKEVNIFYSERHEAELAAGRALVEKNRRRAQFKPT